MKLERPLLRDDVLIVVDNNNQTFLYSRLSSDQPRIRMHPTTALIMTSMDGTRSPKELVARIAELTQPSEQDSRSILTQVYERYGGYIIEGKDKPARQWSEQLLAAIADSDATPPSNPQRRLPAPMTVSWIVTRYCNRHCIYCYNDAKYAADAADENRLSSERMNELLDEMYALGVQQFKLLGGEPLLYSGALEVIAGAVGRGLDVDIITKWCFDEKGARRLADTGLRRICVSLDSISPPVGDRLVGCKGFVDDMLASIDNLVHEGISVVVDCVVCKMNVDGLSDLADRARELGVVQVNVFEYLPSLGRNIDELELTPEDRLTMQSVMDRHSDILRVANIIGDNVERQCSIAVSELSFLPDGRVPLCYQLPLAYNTDLHYGDLTRQSIIEAWQKWPAMWDKERFSGTLCDDCTSLDECTSRGRCLSAAVLHSGQIFGPHPHCPATR